MNIQLTSCISERQLKSQNTIQRHFTEQTHFSVLPVQVIMFIC